ncbi:MAG: hypothetical protein A2Y48_00845 [Nitrospirae bacterium RIFCSPLOW2_12_42_9]|nr:MAG: hypothetical protein A2Y48_00845 [Nitrospirae bacterium RIFCSPLOW2_12_42_9]HBI23743.1 hypothetical protein [Nitrospiraceae bacterium]
MQKTTRQESRSLSYAIKDGVYYAIMAGMGESYISPFAIFLKATNSQIGFLASIPPLIGAFVQLISVNILKQIKDRMTVIITGVIAQALMWLPILLLPMLFRPYAPYLLIIGVTSYFIFGNFATPAWSSLMGDIVPEKTRSSYFGYRNKVMSIFSLGALTLGGLILHGTEKIGNLWIGFSVLFTVALITRLVSSYYLSIMDNPLYEVDHRDDLGLIKFLSGFRHSSFVRFVVYTGLMHLSVMVAAPFFSVYMLRYLHFSYLQFMLVSAVAVLVQYFTLHNWGRFGDKFGNRKILVITGLTLPVVPALWLFSANFYYILLIQMLAGFAWAGFSLSMGNFIFDAIPQPKRARSVAIFNVFNAVGIFTGATFGGWLTRFLPVSINISGLHITMISNLQWLFLISGLMRLVMSLFFLPSIRETREVEPISWKELIFRVSFIKPISGLKFDLFAGSEKEKPEKKKDK